MRRFFCFSLLIATVLYTVPLFAQKAMYYGERAIRFEAKTRRYVVTATGEPCTGYQYKLFPGTTDTMELTCFSNGLQYWDSSFAKNGEVRRAYKWYIHGLKDDSITAEFLTFESGDTSNYYLQYIDNGVKWQRHKAYSHGGKDRKLYLQMESYYRFFRKEETRNFINPMFREEARYDSAGYSESMASHGYSIRYHVNGSVASTVKCAGYEYYLKYGKSPQAPHSEYVGTWTFYAPEGWMSEERLYDDNGVLLENRKYYQGGRIQSKTGYTKPFRDLHLPSPQGMDVDSSALCMVVMTKWYENGVMERERFQVDGKDIEYAYYSNGRPSWFTASGPNRKPFGIHKKWDENGNVTEFINYTVKDNDTICYSAANGKLIALNIRNSALTWYVLPQPSLQYGAYYQRQEENLCKLTSIYKEFHANGKPRLEVRLHNGLRHGTWMEWDSTGMLLVRINYVEDILHGKSEEWYPDGQPKKIFNYTNGIRDGECTEYYPSGQVKWKNTYVNGKPGGGTAYTPEGNVKKERDYLRAFEIGSCLDRKEKVLGSSALFYYFTDSAYADSSVLVPDTLAGRYALKLVLAITTAIPYYDLCSEWKNDNENVAYDLHHSCFTISKSLYTDSNKVVIQNFFTRHGIRIDSIIKAKKPVLGLEEEHFIYYSSTGILNKVVIMDSLQWLVARHSTDGRNGYMMSVDANNPVIPVFGGSYCSSMVSHNGYSIACVDRTKSKLKTEYRRAYVVIYDDLTCDFQRIETSTVPSAAPLKYWALKR